MNNFIKINGRKIGPKYSPYVVAEMSANHNGKIENAYKILDFSKKFGADAVKIQTYHPDKITINMKSSDFMIDGGTWEGQTLHDLYKKAYMPWEWHKPLFNYAKKLGMTIFSSPFDNTAVDLLEDLNSPAYKIASFEAVDLSLIKYVAQTKKPMIISTGIADDSEIQESIEIALENGCKDLAILHCVSGYPAPATDYNLRTIVDMQKKFGVITGLSDHTISNYTAIASIALGSSIIEKHVTLDRDFGGPDDSFSIEPKELRDLCNGVKTAWESLGKVDYGRKSSELSNVKFRRSLYFVKDIKAGGKITYQNVKSIRPGYGLLPKYIDQVIHKHVRVDVKRGQPVKFDLIK